VKLAVGYVAKDHLGYGRMGIELVAALGRLGVTVVDPDEPAPAVCWMTFPSHASGKVDGQMLTSLTMWEGDVLPEAFRDCFDDYDRMFVPSVENVELFSEHHRDVRYVPLGFNPQRWQPVERPPVEGRFRFLISGTGARKGVDVAAAAFRKAFDGRTLDPVPELVIKGKKAEGAVGDWKSNEHLTGPSITHVVGHLPADEEIALYASAHCYVQPARGEGWGLRPLQAIAQGCPTILTDAHGHRAFSHLGIPIPARKGPAGPFIFGSAGNWWEPDVDAVADAMRDVYDNYAAHQATAARNARIARDTLTWDHSAAALAAAFDGALDRPDVDGTPRRLRQRPFPLEVNRRIRCDIGGVMYLFEPDRTYTVPADVLRQMRESGYATN